MIHDTFIDLGDLGEQPVAVHYDYQPRERDSLSGPGCNASATITQLDWLNGLLSKVQIEHFPADVRERLEILCCEVEQDRAANAQCDNYDHAFGRDAY